MESKNFKMEKGEIGLERPEIIGVKASIVDLRKMDAKVTNLADRELKRRAKLFDGKMGI